MSHRTEVMAVLWNIFAYFGQNVVAMTTPLRPLQSGMSFLDWKSPVISNDILVVSRRNAFIGILVPKLVARHNTMRTDGWNHREYVVVKRLIAGMSIEKSSYYYSLTSGPLRVLWDEESTWYISYDHSATGRETITFNGMCGNYDGDPYSEYLFIFICFIYLIIKPKASYIADSKVNTN